VNYLKEIKIPPRLRKYWKVSLYRNAVYLAASNGLGSLLGFVFWTAAARLYTTEEVGIASAIITTMALIGTVSNMGLGWGIVRFLPDDDNHACAMINTSLSVCLVTSVIIAGIFIIGLDIWSPDLMFLKDNLLYAILFIVFCTGTALTTVTDYIFIAERRAGFTTARSLVFNLGKLGLVVLMANILHDNGILNAWGIFLVISLVLAVFFFIPRIRHIYSPFSGFKWSSVNKVIRYSISSHIAVLLWSAPGWVLPLVILNTLGAEANAFFYIAWTVTSAISMLSSSLATSLFSEGSHAESDFDTKTRRSLILIIIILIPVVLLIIFFGRYLLHLFGPAYADNATSVLTVLTLALFPQSVNQIYSSILRVRNKLGMLIVLDAFIAVITLSISIYMIPRVGITGAGYGWLASQIAIAAWFIVWKIRH